MAIQEGPDGPAGPKPERRYAAVERTAAVPVGVVAGGLSPERAFGGLYGGISRRAPACFRKPPSSAQNNAKAVTLTCVIRI